MLGTYSTTRGSILKEIPPKPKQDIAIKASEQSFAFQEAGKFNEAINTLKAILESSSSLEREDRLILELLIGDVMEGLSDFEGALTHFQSARVVSDCFDGTQQDLDTLVLERIAGIYFSRGDFKKAIAFFKKSKALINSSTFASKTADGDEEEIEVFKRLKRAKEATIENNIATCLSAMEPEFRSDEVIAILTASLSTLIETLGAEHPRTVTVQYNLTKEKAKALPDHANRVRPISRGLSIPRGPANVLPHTVVKKEDGKKKKR